MKRVLTISAILGLFASSVFASGSPLFKFDHESNGVNENNEVQHGIENTGRAVAQKGANLSVLHFLFDKQLNEKPNESSSPGCRTENVQLSDLAADCKVANCRAGLDSQGIRNRGGKDSAGNRSAAAWLRETQLGYGEKHLHQIPCADTTAKAGSVRLGRHEGSAEVNDGTRLDVQVCPKEHFGAEIPQALNRAHLTYSKPDDLSGRIGRPALSILLHPHCIALWGIGFGQHNFPNGFSAEKGGSGKIFGQEVLA